MQDTNSIMTPPKFSLGSSDEQDMKQKTNPKNVFLCNLYDLNKIVILQK